MGKSTLIIIAYIVVILIFIGVFIFKNIKLSKKISKEVEENKEELERNEVQLNKEYKKSKIGIIAAASGIVVCAVFIFFIIRNNNKDNIISNKKAKQIAIKKQKEIDNWSDTQKKVAGISEKEIEKKKIEEKNYTDEYKKYQEMSEEEKSKLEVIPEKEKIPYSVIDNIKEEIDDNKEDVIPSKFNLKDKIQIKVEDQGSYGLCWDFASMKSLETNLALKENKNLDLSEIHLDYLTSNLMYGYRDLHEGGNFSDFENYSLISKPVLETQAPYYNNFSYEEYSKFNTLEGATQVTQVINYPYMEMEYDETDEAYEIRKNEFMSLIKKHIMNNGSLYAAINAEKINGSTLYCPEVYDCYTDHAISIVGWDDNYSKENFSGSKPKNDGAFIALNSWGEFLHDNGYFYISYEDANVLKYLSGVVSTSMDDTYKLTDIQSEIIRNIIIEKVNYALIDYNGEKYISKTALNSIYELDLSNQNISNSDLKYLKMFNNLTRLDISNNHITDISSVFENKGLYFLNVSNNPINNISGISKLNELSDLNLSNTNISDISELHLLKDKYIYLDLSNTNITDYSKLPNSTNSLTIKGNNISDINQFMYLKELYHINLSNNNISEINVVDENNNIGKIDLSNNKLKSLNGIDKFKNLTSLNIEKNQISDYSTIKKIINNRNVYFKLNASENNINDISIFNDFKINELELRNNQITDLSNFNNPNITSIDLSNNKITKGLENLENIEILILNNCGITDLSEISKLSKLWTLDLSNNNINDYSEISKLTDLYSLSLENNKINDTISNKSISSLNVTNCNLNDFDISKMPKLMYINIKNNPNIIIGKLLGENKYMHIDFGGMILSEDDYYILNSYKDDNYYYFSDVNFNIKEKIDSDNTIDISKHFLLKDKIIEYMRNKNISIKNGYIDKTFDKIKVINPSEPVYVQYSDVNIKIDIE